MTKRNVADDYQGNEIRRAKFHLLSADPSLASGDAGRFWYDTTNNLFKGWNGSAVIKLGNIIEAVTGSGALRAAAPDANKNVLLSVDPASSSGPGTMTAAHFNMLTAATSSNTASTLVGRDSSGNFSAGLITASLLIIHLFYIFPCSQICRQNSK